MAEDLKHLLAQLRIEKCVLIGHSMGGKTAMTTALTQVSGREISPKVYCDTIVTCSMSPDLTHSTFLSSHGQKGTDTESIFFWSMWHFFSCLFPPTCLFVVRFSGEIGGSGYQSSTDICIEQLPLLHPGHARDEARHWHPTLHCQTYGWGSAAQFGWGQLSYLIQVF